MLSEGYDYVAGTGDSGIVYSAADVLRMSVVCGMKRVGEMCEMCMWLVWGGVGGEVVSESQYWVWALPILWEHGECWRCVSVWAAGV